MPRKGQTKDKLPDKTVLFIDYYCNPQSKTYGQAVQSYLAAGYKDGIGSAQAVSRLLNKDKIRLIIDNYKAKTAIISQKRQEINADYALSCLQNTYDNAIQAKDITNQVACIRLMMQKCGLLSERVVVDITDSRQLEQSLVLQAKRIASVILSDELPELMSPINIDTQHIVSADNTQQVITDSVLTDDTQVLDNNALTES